MAWTYSQSNGQLGHLGEFIATGYSGIAPGWNDPDAQDQPFVGPLPVGTYTIGPLQADGGHMGPFVLALTAWPVTQMFGRDGFFIHGDNPQLNNTASNGCIILARQWRLMIAQSGDTTLIVNTGPPPEVVA